MKSRKPWALSGFVWVFAAAFSTPPSAWSEAVPATVLRTRANCQSCHPAQAKPQPATSMAHAMETVAECGVLQSHPLLTAKVKGYSYRIERRGETSNYSVTDGVHTLTVPIGWAFGLGSAGQTYVYQKDGAFFESMVSFYQEIDGLDITMGDQNLRPASLEEAAGRLMGSRETSTCFGCHSTGAVVGSTLTLASLIPGVQCERCHGDSSQHLEALKSGNVKSAPMKKLGGLSAEETNQFCGQCHRSWEQIAMNGPHGVLNVRFQPYRLTNSRCYDVDDRRIKCTACHDPHVEIKRVSAGYDAKCQACHAGGKPGAKVCKVGGEDCASCHMPKIELPGAHHRFTDHNIRIVSKNGAYPD